MNTILHFLRFVLALDQPASQVTDAELAMLLNYASNTRIAVELGCYEGKTAIALAHVSEHLYSIDPFFKGRVGFSYGQLIAKIHARRNQVTNVTLIKKMSWEAAPSFYDPIDFLFVDADHTYDAIRRDWLDWSPKVRVGGIVSLHDSKKAVNSPFELGSMRFYKDDIPTLKNFKEIDSIDSLAVLRKEF